MASVKDTILAENGTFLMYYGDNWGPTTSEIAHTSISNYGFTEGYITGELPPVYIAGIPNFAVLDIRSGRLIVDGIFELDQLLEAVAFVNHSYN